MKDFNALELIGLFESIQVNDEKAADLKSQVKAIGADTTARFKEFGESNDVSAKKLRSAYKYYLDKVNSEDDDVDKDDPLYDLMMKVDMGLEADAKKSQENQ